MTGKLPDLPGSTNEDLERNDFHSFFKKTPREVWIEAEIHHTKLVDPPKCEHFFEYTEGGVECKKCFIGFQGGIEIKSGRIKGS